MPDGIFIAIAVDGYAVPDFRNPPPDRPQGPAPHRLPVPGRVPAVRVIEAEIARAIGVVPQVDAGLAETGMPVAGAKEYLIQIPKFFIRRGSLVIVDAQDLVDMIESLGSPVVSLVKFRFPVGVGAVSDPIAPRDPERPVEYFKREVLFADIERVFTGKIPERRFDGVLFAGAGGLDQCEDQRQAEYRPERLTAPRERSAPRS